MKDALRSKISEALSELLVDAQGVELPDFALDPPRQEAHGDFACNAAMMLAKTLKKKPRDIAADLQQALGDAGGLLEKSEIAGPGFLNLWLRSDRWQALLQEIVASGSRYGSSEFGAGAKVQIEFVSANPTGPLSTGHGRQGVLGDCIARLLDFTGHKTTREYYFNNAGRQMRVLGDSVRARYLEALGRAAAPPASAFEEGAVWPSEIDGLPVAFPQDGYQGEYIREVAEAIVEEHGEGWIDEPGEGGFRARAETAIFADIRATLEAMDIRFDVYTNEQSLYDEGHVERAIQDLRDKGLVYDKDGAVWFESTSFGLDRDRVLIKGTGEATYLTPDIAYHREKFRRGFDKVIDIQGADHIDQFPYLRAAIGSLGCDPERVELILHQFVTVTSGGNKVKQSTRKATFITIDELLEDVGPDVFRFFMIERKADGHLDFDLDLAKDRNWKKNPAYYVQYAHARTCGLERKAAAEGVELESPTAFDPARLSLPEELEIVKKLGEFPELVERAAASREPHHVAYYLRELAGLWNPYLQDGSKHRIVSDDAGLTAARLGLASAIRVVLSNGLGLLGISAPEQM